MVVNAFTFGRTGISRSGATTHTGIAALIAGALLAAVYVGLGFVGQLMPNGAGYSDGATLLSDASVAGHGFVWQVRLRFDGAVGLYDDGGGLVGSLS